MMLKSKSINSHDTSVESVPGCVHNALQHIANSSFAYLFLYLCHCLHHHYTAICSSVPLLIDIRALLVCTDGQK